MPFRLPHLTPALAFCAALMAPLPAAAFDIEAMTPAERAALGAEVRRYILENPEIVFEAAALVEQRRAQQQVANDVALVANNAADLFSDPDAWVGGNPDGDITLVEFIDYRCGYCRRAHGEVAELIESDGNIRFIVKEFPILGEASVISSRFAIAARRVAGDDAYKAAHDALVTVNSDLNDRALTRLAQSLDLDAEAILAEMNSAEVTRIINNTRQLAQRMNITGTPTFVMGDQMLRGYLPLDGMRQILDQIRAEG